MSVQIRQFCLYFISMQKGVYSEKANENPHVLEERKSLKKASAAASVVALGAEAESFLAPLT